MAVRTRRKKSKAKRSARMRASWKGPLKFGLVSFPVQAVNAVVREEGDIHFHQLHATCHRRIRYEKVCPVHGEVDKEEIVSGFEFKKGQYVEIDQEELDALRTEHEKALTIDAFIDADQIDPIYFDGRHYYLIPDGDEADEPYQLFLEAMTKQEKCAVGEFIFSGKEQLALVRPLEHVLLMELLNYEPEIRPPADVHAVKAHERLSPKKLHLANTLIDSWTDDDFDLAAYKNRARERTEELIEAKLEGREIVAPKDEEPREVINLMDALKQSLSHDKHSRRSRRRRPRAS